MDFAVETSPHPLLIHCAQGVSRSAALALLLLLRESGLTEEGVNESVSALLDLRPQASPNQNLVFYGLQEFFGSKAALLWTEKILAFPDFRHNARFA